LEELSLAEDLGALPGDAPREVSSTRDGPAEAHEPGEKPRPPGGEAPGQEEEKPQDPGADEHVRSIGQPEGCVRTSDTSSPARG